MIEVKNKLYIQRLLAKKLFKWDWCKAVTYTQFLGDAKIPFWYKQVHGETVTLDLSRSMEEIYFCMKSNTRNEIKRAIKEGCTFEINNDFEAFVSFYNDFSKSKNLDSFINVHTLTKYDGMTITCSKSNNGVVLAMHATVINKKDKEAMLFYSCSQRLNPSLDKRLIGWGNRFLHYKEFELFKQMGIERYEWNGVNTNKENSAQYNISLFKLGFGGEVVESLSLRTPLFLLLKRMQKIIQLIHK